MKKIILLICLYIPSNFLFSQIDNNIEELFKNCKNDSLFIEEHSLKKYEVLELTSSEVENSLDSLDLFIFSTNINEVIGPYKTGKNDVWYKIINIEHSNKYELFKISLKSKRAKKTNKILNSIKEDNDCDINIESCCNKYQDLSKKCEVKWFDSKELSSDFEVALNKQKDNWFRFKDKAGIHIIKRIDFEENRRSNIEFLKLVRKPKYFISFPSEPQRHLESMTIPVFGPVVAENLAYIDSSDLFYMLSIEIPDKEKTENLTNVDKISLIQGMMSFLIKDIGFTDPVIFNDIQDEKGIVQEFVKESEMGKFVMRGIFIKNSIYLIMCKSDQKGIDLFMNSFQHNY